MTLATPPTFREGSVAPTALSMNPAKALAPEAVLEASAASEPMAIPERLALEATSIPADAPIKPFPKSLEAAAEDMPPSTLLEVAERL